LVQLGVMVVVALLKRRSSWPLMLALHSCQHIFRYLLAIALNIWYSVLPSLLLSFPLLINSHLPMEQRPQKEPYLPNCKYSLKVLLLLYMVSRQRRQIYFLHHFH
jgi:hypothetical protein